MSRWMKKILQSIAVLGVVFLLFLGFIHTKYLFLNDVSIQPVHERKDHHEVGVLQPLARTPVALVTYAGGPSIFFKNQNALHWSCINRGIDYVFNYHYSFLDPSFTKRHEKIFSKPTGAGYWLWKPWIILETLKKLPKNAIILYLDVGIVIRKPITSLIDEYLTPGTDVVLVRDTMEKIKTIEHNTARHVLYDLGMDRQEIRSCPGVWAGIVLVRNTDQARSFLQQWLKYCENEDHLTGQVTSKKDLPPHSNFSSHAHDQSLLSITASQYKDFVKLVPLEKSDQYFFWHHRHNIKNPGKDFETLIHKIGYGVRGIEWKFLNHPWIVKLRQHFLSGE